MNETICENCIQEHELVSEDMAWGTCTRCGDEGFVFSFPSYEEEEEAA